MFKKSILIISLLLGVFIVTLNAQSPTQLRKKCPNSSTYSDVTITAVGNITVDPCSGRSTTFTQNVVLPSGTTSGGLTGNPNLAFKATAYTFNNLTDNSEFAIGFTPSTTVGLFSVGDCSTTPTVCFSQDQSAVTSSLSAGTGSTFSQTATTALLTTTGSQIFRGISHTFSNNAGTAEFNMALQPSNSSGNFSVGDCTTTPTTCITLAQGAATAAFMGANITIGDNSNLGILSTTGVVSHLLNRTVTAAGTTGAQTINKQAGTVNVAAGQASIVVTNNTVTTTSIPFVVLRTADGTCTFVKSAVSTANTLTITLNANCTAETSVGFIVYN